MQHRSKVASFGNVVKYATVSDSLSWLGSLRLDDFVARFPWFFIMIASLPSKPETADAMTLATLDVVRGLS